MQAINVFRRNVFSSSAGKICQSLHPAETTIPGSFSRRMATSGSLLAEIFNRNKDEGKRICEAVDGNYLNERIFQSKELRRKHIEKMRRMDPHDKIVERYDSWTAAYESKEKELIEECGGDIPDKPAIERWAMALYLKFIETKDVGAYVLKETPDENGVPCNDEDIASLITKARNIAYVRNVGGGKGEHWAKEHVLRVGLPESGNELLRCIYYPFFDVSKGDAGAFLAELWVINLLYHILGGTGKLLNQSLNGVGPVKDPDGKKNHRFGILLIENFQENLGNGVAGINGGLVAHTLEQFKENIPGEVPILEVVTAKQKQPKKLYVVREGGEYGKIIMAYVGIAKLRLGLGGRSNELTEADIGTEGKFHRSLFFVEPYAKEVHGPFDDIAVDEGRLEGLKAEREPTRYVVREGDKDGKIIMTCDSITKLNNGLGGRYMTEADIGTEKKFHRGMFIEPYDDELHGRYDDIAVDEGRVEELKAECEPKRYVVRECDKYGKVIMTYDTITKLRLGLGRDARKLTEADIGTEGKFHRGVFFVEPYDEDLHGPFDDIAVDERRVEELKAKCERTRYVVREGGEHGKVIRTYDEITQLRRGLGGGNSKLTEANIGTEGMFHRGVFIEPYDDELHGPFGDIAVDEGRVEELKAECDPTRYVVREGDKDGKIIMTYDRIAKLKLGLGGGTRKLTEADIGSVGKLHRGMFFIEPYDEERHGPFDDIAVDEGRVEELKTKCEPTRYVVREGGKHGKVIRTYDRITKLKLGLGGNTSKLTEANIGTGGMLHRSVFFIEPYDDELHGRFDDIAVDEGRVKELKAKRESKYAAREGGKYGKEIMTYDRITKLHLEIGGGTSKLGVANIGTEGQLHRGMHIEPYDEEVHGPFDWVL